MTIASEIQRIKNNIADAYGAAEAKGATMPVIENSNNLATTIESITAGGTSEVMKSLLALDAAVKGGAEMTEEELGIAMETGLDPIINGTGPIPAATTLHQYDRVDGKATVAGFWTDGNGQRYAVCVVDAAYRSGSKYWSITAVDTSLPNYKSLEAVLAAGESGTWNTDTILNNYTPSDYPAFNVARNACTVSVDGQTFESCLLNAAELLMINTDRAALDTYDTTLTEYPNNSLSGWNIEGNSGGYCWTSNEFNDDSAWQKPIGKPWGNGNKYNNNIGVIPVIEIPVDENGTVITN